MGYEAIKKLNVRHSAIFLIFVMTWKTIKRGGGPDITFYYGISPWLIPDFFARESGSQDVDIKSSHLEKLSDIISIRSLGNNRK